MLAKAARSADELEFAQSAEKKFTAFIFRLPGWALMASSWLARCCETDCCLLGEVSHLTALATSWPTGSNCWALATLCKKRNLKILPGHMPVHAWAWLRHCDLL